MSRTVTVILLVSCLLLGCETPAGILDEHAALPCDEIYPEATRSLDLREGLRFKARIVSHVDASTDLQPGETFDSVREQGMAFNCEVLDRSPNGAVRISFEYNWVRDMQCMHGSVYLYDSADPNSEAHYPKDEDALNELLGRSFIAEIAPDGRVCCIEGFGTLYDSLLDALVGAYASSLRQTSPKIRVWRQLTEEEIDGLKKAFRDECERFYRGDWLLSEQRLKDLVQQFFVVKLPKDPSPDQSWQVEQLVPSLGLRRCNTWTVKDASEGAMVLELYSHTHTDPNLCDPNAVKGDGTTDALIIACCKRGTLTGSRMGEFTVDSGSGLSSSGSYIEELSGVLKLRDPYIHKTKIFSFPTKRTECVSTEITIQQ